MFSIAAINESNDARRKIDGSCNSNSASGKLGPTKEAQESALFKSYESALKEIQSGRISQAQTALEHIIQHPLCSTTHSHTAKRPISRLVHLKYLSLKNLGEIYVRSSRSKDALRAFLEASSIDSGDVVLWQTLALQAVGVGLLGVARRALENGLRCSPRHQGCRKDLAQVLLGIGDYMAPLFFSMADIAGSSEESMAVVEVSIAEEDEIAVQIIDLDSLSWSHVFQVLADVALSCESQDPGSDPRVSLTLRGKVFSGVVPPSLPDEGNDYQPGDVPAEVDDEGEEKATGGGGQVEGETPDLEGSGVGLMGQEVSVDAWIPPDPDEEAGPRRTKRKLRKVLEGPETDETRTPSFCSEDPVTRLRTLLAPFCESQPLTANEVVPAVTAEETLQVPEDEVAGAAAVPRWASGASDELWFCLRKQRQPEILSSVLGSFLEASVVNGMVKVFDLERLSSLQPWLTARCGGGDYGTSLWLAMAEIQLAVAETKEEVDRNLTGVALSLAVVLKHLLAADLDMEQSMAQNRRSEAVLKDEREDELAFGHWSSKSADLAPRSSPHTPELTFKGGRQLQSKTLTNLSSPPDWRARVRYHWTTGRLASLEGDKALAKKHLTSCLSQFPTSQEVHEAIPTAVVPSLDAPGSISPEEVSRKLQKLELEEVVSSRAEAAMKAGNFQEVVDMLSPVLLGTDPLKGDLADKGLRCLALASCRVLKPDWAMALTCHCRRFHLCQLAGADVAELVGDVHGCLLQAKEKAELSPPIGQILRQSVKRVMLSAMEIGLLSPPLSDEVIAKASMAFCMVGAMGGSQQEQIPLFQAVHAFLADQGRCQLAGFLRWAVAHLMTVRSTLLPSKSAPSLDFGVEVQVQVDPSTQSLSPLAVQAGQLAGGSPRVGDLDAVIGQLVFCLYGVNVASLSGDVLSPAGVEVHGCQRSCQLDSAAEASEMFLTLMPFIQDCKRDKLKRYLPVIRQVHKQFRNPPAVAVLSLPINAFLDDESLDESAISILPAGSMEPSEEEQAQLADYHQVYASLYHLVSLTENLSVADVEPSFLMTAEGAARVADKADVYKFDLHFNPGRYLSWKGLALLFYEEMDVLWNSGSKILSMDEWVAHPDLMVRLLGCRRRAHRCLLKCLCITDSLQEKAHVHGQLALMLYESLQNMYPTHDQMGPKIPRDDSWQARCRDAYRHFEAAYKSKPDWTHQLYLAKLSLKLGHDLDRVFSHLTLAHSIHPTAVDIIYRIHATRVKILCKNIDQITFPQLQILARHGHSPDLLAKIDSIMAAMDPCLPSPGSDSSQEASRKVAWGLLFDDCMEGLRTCTEGEVKHFHRSRYRLAQSLLARGLPGDAERAKDELAFCFRLPKKSEFCIHLWEIDLWMGKGSRQGRSFRKGSSSRKGLEVGMRETSRKFVSCARKYLVLYIQLAEMTGDIAILERVHSYIHKDPRFSKCLGDIALFALAKYIAASLAFLASPPQQSQPSGSILAFEGTATEDRPSSDPIETPTQQGTAPPTNPTPGSLFQVVVDHLPHWEETAGKFLLKAVHAPKVKELSAQLEQCIASHLNSETDPNKAQKSVQLIRKRALRSQSNVPHVAILLRHAFHAWCQAIASALQSPNLLTQLQASPDKAVEPSGADTKNSLAKFKILGLVQSLYREYFHVKSVIHQSEGSTEQHFIPGVVDGQFRAGTSNVDVSGGSHVGVVDGQIGAGTLNVDGSGIPNVEHVIPGNELGQIGAGALNVDVSGGFNVQHFIPGVVNGQTGTGALNVVAIEGRLEERVLEVYRRAFQLVNGRLATEKDIEKLKEETAKKISLKPLGSKTAVTPKVKKPKRIQQDQFWDMPVKHQKQHNFLEASEINSTAQRGSAGDLLRIKEQMKRSRQTESRQPSLLFDLDLDARLDHLDWVLALPAVRESQKAQPGAHRPKKRLKGRNSLSSALESLMVLETNRGMPPVPSPDEAGRHLSLTSIQQ